MTTLTDMIKAMSDEVLELGDIPERDLTNEEAAIFASSINAIKSVRCSWLISEIDDNAIDQSDHICPCGDMDCSRLPHS